MKAKSASAIVFPKKLPDIKLSELNERLRNEK
jgi:hypothetical protein